MTKKLCILLSWRVKNNALSWSRTAEGDSCQGVTLSWSGSSFVGHSPSTGSHGGGDKGDSHPRRFGVINGQPGARESVQAF